MVHLSILKVDAPKQHYKITLKSVIPTTVQDELLKQIRFYSQCFQTYLCFVPNLIEATGFTLHVFGVTSFLFLIR